MDPVTAKKEISYLALGDSYTIGEGVKDQERYPDLLIEELKKKEITIKGFNILARTGWITQNLKRALEY